MLFYFQINSLRDVSTPAYSQLVKIRGKENENVQVTATQQPENRVSFLLIYLFIGRNWGFYTRT